MGCETQEDIEIEEPCTPGYVVSNQTCHDGYENGSNASAVCGALETEKFISLSDIRRFRYRSIYHNERNNTISVGRYVYNIIREDCIRVSPRVPTTPQG